MGLFFFNATSGLEDIGYEDQFQDVLEEVEDEPLKLVGTIPDWLEGSFYQTGPGRWTLGNMKFTHALDGFSKVHKFQFRHGKVTFTAKFLRSGYLNQSIAHNEIVWGVVAQETQPPRKNPGPLALMKAPNDNNNVNPWLFQSGRLHILSDTPEIVDVSPDNLNFTEEISMYAFKNVSDPRLAPTMNGGSAHPHCAADGSYIGLREAARYMPLGNSRMAVYKLHPQSPNVVQDIVRFDVPRASYTHSFGITRGMEDGDHAVVVAQPVYFNMLAMAQTGTLKKGFYSPEDGKTMIHILPLDASKGQKPKVIEHSPFFFGHFLNTFSTAPGKITFDLDFQSQIFFDRFSLDVQLNKDKRDNWTAAHGNAYPTPTRYEVDIESGAISSKALFPDPKTQCAPNSKWCELDLFKLHPEDIGRQYCGFWAQQVYFNSSSFAAQAVVRAELCGKGGPRIAASWYRPNTYPGEAQFVPKPGSQDKTEGVMVFRVYEGDTKRSKLIVADAKTLKTLAHAELPIQIPYTVHGNFYTPSQQAHCIPSEDALQTLSV